MNVPRVSPNTSASRPETRQAWTGGGSQRGRRSYAVRMTDSPLSPQEFWTGTAAHAELGPKYSGAVRTGPWVGQG